MSEIDPFGVRPKHEDEARPWERQPAESAKAYSAFTLFLSQGQGRSLRAVSDASTKHPTLIRRWSARWSWRERSAAYDRHIARAISEKSVARLATQVARSLDYADVIDAKTKAWADTLDPTTLMPMEAAALSRVSIELKRRSFETADGGEVSFSTALPTPTFVIQVISPGTDASGNPMIGVQLPDATAPSGWCYGYIPCSQIERLKADRPDAVVLI